MKTLSKRLEAESVSGGKYWEVEVDGCDFKVRFGKLGQDKDWTIKTFATNEEAYAEGEKKTRAKLKKGYVEVGQDEVPDVSIKVKVLSFEDADKLENNALSSTFGMEYYSVLYIEGNVDLKDDFLPAINKLTTESFDLIVIKGNLNVEGRIRLYDYTPSLLVDGVTRAETLEGGDCEIFVDKVILDYFMLGFMSDGILETGLPTSPYIINYGHDLRTVANHSITIDNYGNDSDYQFGRENIERSFVNAVIDKDDNDQIDIEKLYKRLKAKQPVMKEGAMSTADEALLEVENAIISEALELDLRTRKLDAFPMRICEMSWLRSLAIGGNDLGTLPAELGKLVNLERLFVDSCGLETLPEEIGKLENLRVLSVAGNRVLDSAFSLPDSVGQLKSLEEIDVSSVCADLDEDEHGFLPGMHSFSFPVSMGNLKKLKVIKADQTKVVFPKSMYGMESIEEISMAGQSWSYLIAFPEGIGSFSNLKKLNVAKNFFKTIPTEITKLTNLEELNLSALARLETPVPDLSSLSKLKVLKLNGLSGHSHVRQPAHAILAQIFSMDLPALE